MIRARYIFGALGGMLIAGGCATYLVGRELAKPTPSVVGPPPEDLHAEVVAFPSGSGSRLKGWFIRGQEGRGGVVLMHGIHATRLAMLGRARFLTEAGYSVLLFDFQANGESAGAHQTFGFLESRDARAACEYLRSRIPGEKIGAIGLSMGGAASVLGSNPLEVDALVLEAVFPTIEDATSNRIAERLGPPGRLLTPLLLWQLHPRLGLNVEELRPIDRIGDVKAPVFVIAGGADVCTPAEESRRLFAAAPEPKQYWEIPGARHEDFLRVVPSEYRTRILEFFDRYLASQPGSDAELPR